MGPVSVICSGNFIPRSGLSAVSAEMIEAMYSQMLADGQYFVPLLSGAIPIDQWRDRELARIVNA